MIETLEIHLPQIGIRRARAWFDSVFNPYIKGLERELYFIEKRNWTFNSKSSQLESIGNYARWFDTGYRENLEDVRESLPDFREFENKHERSANFLYNDCLNLHTVILKNQELEFKSKIEGYFQRLLKSSTDFERRDVEYMLQDFEKNPESATQHIAEYLVNNYSELPSQYLYSSIINHYSAELQQVLEGNNNTSVLKQQIIETSKDLQKVISDFLTYIRKVRREISLQLDIPYISTNE